MTEGAGNASKSQSSASRNQRSRSPGYARPETRAKMPVAIPKEPEVSAPTTPSLAQQFLQATRGTLGMWLSFVHGAVDLATKPVWWGLQQLSRGSGLLALPKPNGE